MARDEMNEIKDDRWTNEIWKAATEGPNRLRMAFHFGAKDQWVADETRDDLIISRSAARNAGIGPLMEIDTEDIPHAFCIRE